jgi:hypothetical protein
MCNMSRIRNTLRLQSPEERVLNGLLAVVLAILVAVGVVKARHPRSDAAAEVRGVQIDRVTLPRTGGPTTPTSVGAPTTTTTLSPEALWLVTMLERGDAPITTTTTGPGGRSTSTTTRPGPLGPFPPPIVVTTTRPPRTTTTTRPRPTTTTTSSTTTTTTTTTAPPAE